VFARNFVRQFASALDMDAQPLLASLPKVDMESFPLPNPAPFGRAPRRDPRWSAAFSFGMWVILVVGTTAAGYLYLNSEQPPIHASVTPATTSRQNVAPPTVPQPEPEKDTAKETAPDPANHPVQVLLKAHEASWVQITADGKNAFTGILNPNDSREVEADALVKVTAGNAGGVEISLNGKSLDPLGPSGQVRTVRLTAEGPQLPQKTPQTSSAAL
jgi:cytoskeletal protein RodZ